MTEIEKLVSELIDAFDRGELEMNSPEVGSDGVMPHPWHEEWVHHARTALARSQVR